MSSAPRRVLNALWSPWTLAVAAAVLAVVGLRFAFFGGGPHVVTVDFADADGLVPGNEVRIAGIEAGSVKSVNIVHNGDPGAMNGIGQYAEVQVSIDDTHWPLHTGTQFAVRPKGVLSNVYVSLTPGHGAETIDLGRPVPVTQTQSPVNIDELSNVFDPKVRDAIRTQIYQGDVMLGGQGDQNGAANLNGLLVNANPLTRDLSPITAVLAQRTPELDRLNTEFGTILGELASEDQNLGGVINNGNTLLAAIAAKQDALKGTLDHAATTFTQLDQVLAGEQNNLGTIFEKGPSALDKSKRALDLLLPLVRNVNPHIPHLDILLHDFITATGYNIKNLDAMRVDASLPNGRTASPCGGEPSEQPKCATPASMPFDGSAGTATQVSLDTTVPLLGGLVG